MEHRNYWFKITILMLILQGPAACIYAAFPTPTYGIRFRRIFDAQADHGNTEGGTMLGRELAPAVTKYYTRMGESAADGASSGGGASPFGGGSGGSSSAPKTMLSLSTR